MAGLPLSFFGMTYAWSGLDHVTGKEVCMLRWALTFLIVAIVAAVLGLTGIAGVSVDIAKILFLIFIVLFVLSMLLHLVTGRRLPGPPV